jgi:hypothetical protein
MVRTLGNVMPYGKMPGLPRFIVKKVNLANPVRGIPIADLSRSIALAYEDGYADGREYGPSGKFIPSHYEQEHVYQYAAGFKAGCKVREANQQEVNTRGAAIP